MIRLTILILIILLTYLNCFSGEFVVSKKGKLNTITLAVKMAERGDTIFVNSGVYREFDILVDKPLSLIGLNKPVIDAEEKGFIFDVTADEVMIKGFVLNNVGSSYTTDFAAIRTYRIQNFVIDSNEFNNPFFAIQIQKSKDGIISNNIIKGIAKEEHNSGNGIHLWHVSKVEVLDNKISGMRDGIYFEFVKHSLVYRNECRDNLRYGLHFMFSNDDKYEGNIFERNGAGVAVMFSKNIFMRRNTFRLNWGTASYGLLLKEINDAEIIGNTFEQNTIGINAEGSNRVNYERNNFINNGWAVKFLGACYGNKLISNNFMHNAFDVSYSGGINGNMFDRNYWSEYSGYDLNNDAIGDVPYRPVKLFSYIVNRTPETIILLRSFFVDLINFSEKVSPVFTPDNLKDFHPQMRPVNDSH